MTTVCAAGLTMAVSRFDSLHGDFFFGGWGAQGSRPVLLNLVCGAGSVGKIWSACGQHEMQYTDSSMNKCKYNFRHYLTCVFVYTSRAIQIYW